MNTSPEHARLSLLLSATPGQLAGIDQILAGGAAPVVPLAERKLLVTQTTGAKALGVSRWTIAKLAKQGVLRRVEILPGKSLYVWADLEAVAAGKG